MNKLQVFEPMENPPITIETMNQFMNEKLSHSQFFSKFIRYVMHA